MCVSFESVTLRSNQRWRLLPRSPCHAPRSLSITPLEAFLSRPEKPHEVVEAAAKEQALTLNPKP
jgi:hypothetical protein